MTGILPNEYDKVIRSKEMFRFWNGQIQIPKEIRIGPPFTVCRILEQRNKLLSGRKFGELSFRDFLKSTYPGAVIIEQFPIIIDDRKLWDALLGTSSPEIKAKHRNQWLFFLDFYLPEYNLAFEIDYDVSHDSEYDYLRDQYTSTKMGIHTARFFDYRACSTNHDERIHLLVDTLMKTRKDKFTWSYRYDDYILSETERFDLPKLKILEAIRDKYGYWNIKFTLTKKVYRDIMKRVGNNNVRWEEVAKVASLIDIELTVV